MKAVSSYEASVRRALHSGIEAVVVSAGLPLDLPDIARDFPEVALIPILSDVRGVQLLVRTWEKKGRLPDAIVIEPHRLAGGHLGAAKLADLSRTLCDFEVVIPQVLEFFKAAGIERDVPLIAAGGIGSREDIRRLQALGAAGVQLGTAFVVTQECDADLAFKQVLADARPEDMVELISVAGLPARVVRTPGVEKYLRIEPKLKAVARAKKRCHIAFDCLAHCGLRAGMSNMGQFCIDQQIGHAMAGDRRKGLFFRGAVRLPFGREIRSVQELMQWLVGGVRPLAFN